MPKVAATAEKRIEIKFKDDEDATGRTPARPMPARYVVLVPDGYDEEAGEAKPEAEEGDAGEESLAPDAGTGSRAAGGAGSRGASRGENDPRDEDFGDAMGELPVHFKLTRAHSCVSNIMILRMGYGMHTFGG